MTKSEIIQRIDERIEFYQFDPTWENELRFLTQLRKDIQELKTVSE